MLGAAGAIAAVAAPGALADGLPATAAPTVHDPTVLVQLYPVSSDALAAEVAGRNGLRVTRTFNNIGWVEMAIPGNVRAAHDALRTDGSVSRIDFPQPGENLAPAFTPRDEVFGANLMVTTDQGLQAQAAWHFTEANFPAAWDISKGQGQAIAVIDSEFDVNHPDLQAKIETPKNLKSGSANFNSVNVAAETTNELHGTHVAGLAAAQTDNSIGVAGACFDCMVIPIKINTSGDLGRSQVDASFLGDFVQALDYASQGRATVINMSLGTTRDHAPLRDAINLASARGKVLVAAAGNGQINEGGAPNYPAAYPNVIAVANVQPGGQISPSSTNGEYVDVAAPGGPVVSTWDTRAQGNFGTGYHAIGGTSMASPIVAGLAVLVRQVRPDLTPAEVQQVIEASATDLGAPGKDRVYGAGRIDAFRALNTARAFTRPDPTPPAPPPPPPPPPVATIQAVPTSIFLFRNRASVRTGKKVMLTGFTRPARAFTNLRLQRFRARGGWATVAVVKTNRQGKFAVNYKAAGSGQYRVRVILQGSARFTAAASRGVNFKAMPTKRRAR